MGQSGWPAVGAAELEAHVERNREERHVAALLFALMVGSRSGLTRLMEQCGVEDAGRKSENARLFYEYTFLRDWWHGLDNDSKHSGICDLLGRLAEDDDEREAVSWLGGQAAPEPFNRLFSTRPSKTSIESPARWSTSLIEGLGSESLRRPALLLAWMFRIKPDIVVLLPDGEVVSFEAKLDSDEDVYRSHVVGADSIRQIDLQKRMFKLLLGVTGLHSVLLCRPSGTVSARPRIDWPSAFDCFSADERALVEPHARADVLST